MSERRIARGRWLALLAGLLLLSSGTGLERATALLAPPEPETPEVALRDWAVGQIRAFNRRLSPVLSERIADAVLRCGREHALPPDLVLAVLIAESSARPHALSPKGAIGLMQVMPHMWRVTGLPGNAGHVEANIQAGCLLLADNIRRLGENDGVSAYFWGSVIRGDSYLQRITDIRRDLGLGLAVANDRSRG